MQSPIVTLEGDDVKYLAKVFAQAAADGNSVRVCVDGGFKLSVAQRMWTPALGKVQAL